MRRSLADAREYGAVVRRVAGVPVWKQAAWTFVLWSRYGLEPKDFYKFKLFDKDNRSKSKFYLRGAIDANLSSLVMDRVRPGNRVLDDKVEFFRACQDRDVPSVDLVASFVNGDVTWHAPSAQLPARDLFAKPVQGDSGRGAQLWTYKSGAYVSEAGDRVTAEFLVASLAERSKTMAYILQPRLQNHPALAAISSGGLSTVRLVTALGVPQGEPTLEVAVLRMAATSSTVDNFGEGGLAAPVDFETGRLGPAVKKDLPDAVLDFETHPSTGHRIAGALVPCWAEVVETGLRAHRAFRDLRVVGWDVAVTTEGVVVVEGNARPCSNLSQQPGSRPLGLTSIPGIYLRALEA